jgi:hypothetical protein
MDVEHKAQDVRRESRMHRKAPSKASMARIGYLFGRCHPREAMRTRSSFWNDRGAMSVKGNSYHAVLT